MNIHDLIFHSIALKNAKQFGVLDVHWKGDFYLDFRLFRKIVKENNLEININERESSEYTHEISFKIDGLKFTAICDEDELKEVKQ